MEHLYDVDSERRPVGIFRLHIQRVRGYRWEVWHVSAPSLDAAIGKTKTKYPSFYRVQAYSDDIAYEDLDRVLKISEHPANVRYREREARWQKQKTK